jgi:hypothetical protein
MSKRPLVTRTGVLALGVAAALVGLASEPSRAAGVRGQASALTSTTTTLLGSTTISLADTGQLSDATDSRRASELSGVAGAVRGDALHAATIGWPDQVASEASAAGVAVSVNGFAIGADFVMSRAVAKVGAAASGSTAVEGLVVGGVPVQITGAANQTVPFPGGRVIVNEQQASATGITVNALHIVVTGVLDVVVASATAGLD